MPNITTNHAITYTSKRKSCLTFAREMFSSGYEKWNEMSLLVAFHSGVNKGFLCLLSLECRPLCSFKEFEISPCAGKKDRECTGTLTNILTPVYILQKMHP